MPLSFPSPTRALEAVIYAEERQIARCLVRHGQYLIGQSPSNEIVVDEPSVSTTHARLTIVSEEEIYIEDLESANGTFVGGHPVHGQAPISLLADVRIGTTTLCFRRAGLPAAIFRDLSPSFFQEARYQLGEVVVQGSTSTIYEAYDTALGRTVALKVLLPASQRDAPTVLRLIRDAQITGNLGHPGILPIYDLGLDESDRLYVTTRFMEAEPLNRLLDRLEAGDAAVVERYSFGALLCLWQKTCDVIAFAHSMGVVHGDLKPEAIQVGNFGEVFVTNWTYAAVLAGEDGKPPAIKVPEAVIHPALSTYSSPEQATGNTADVDRRTDIHSLGGILYRIITLRDPLAGENEDALLEAALTSKVAEPSTLPKEAPHPHWPGGKLPDFCAAVAMKALSYAPEQRQQSVIELQREIAAYQEGAAAGKDGKNLWKQFAGLLGQR